MTTKTFMRVVVHMPPELFALMELACAKVGVTRSEFVRRAVDAKITRAVDGEHKSRVDIDRDTILETLKECGPMPKAEISLSTRGMGRAQRDAILSTLVGRGLVTMDKGRSGRGRRPTVYRIVDAAPVIERVAVKPMPPWRKPKEVDAAIERVEE